MKKIMIVALYESISQYYRQHLYDIFGGMVEVEYYYIENNEKEFHFDGDLIVASSNILFEHVKKLNRNNIETIVMRRTFTKEGFEKLKSMDVNTEMYFISTFHEIAVECISKLYELGIQNIRLIPYNPKLDRSGQGTDSVTAVVAGDTREIPSFIEKTIDIGDRAIDLSTIADIGTVLKLPAQSLYQILERYKKRLVYSDYGISKVIDTSTDIKRQLRTILNISNDSIIATDLNGIISEYNDNSQKTFGIPRSQVIGKKLDEIFPEIVIDDIIQKKEAVTNDLVTIQNITYVIDKHGIYDEEDQLTSIVIFCQKYMELENQQSKLRSKMIPSGHVARYTMDHIQGDSQIIKDLKPIARKMARSSSTVLVTGESGTGKEVFAQAIHNASDRANKPFIVVNCSALSPSLLESELFGYEEGAFTGAKKGGKIGMFEMADKGTIFLDEIGEMPYELQAKLLRVLMEREVMRVGGIDVIKVDVRVIAATNKNLLKLIEEGQFREDLYYRINVLPLPLPALRERKEDIPILAQAFMDSFGAEKKLTPKILKILTDYDWPGNIRELHNCIEYMYQLSDSKIEVWDIPENIRNYQAGKFSYKAEESREFPLLIGVKEQAVLRMVAELNGQGKSAGRKVIHDYLAWQNIRIGEQDVRAVLKRLEELELVRIYQGRGGTQITDLGRRYITELVHQQQKELR